MVKKTLIIAPCVDLEQIQDSIHRFKTEDRKGETCLLIYNVGPVTEVISPALPDNHTIILANCDEDIQTLKPYTDFKAILRDAAILGQKFFPQAERIDFYNVKS